jgi:uncharacterized protein
MKTMHVLPTALQPIRMAARGIHLKGILPLSALPRLQDLLSDPEGEVAIDLQFGVDDAKIPYIQGSLKACLPLICQRCLKAMLYDIALQISVSPVLSEAAGEKLPAQYEPLFLQEDGILLSEMLEEEILLGLPAVPKHAELDCAS